ncbi:hypothetical protein OWV82_003909 [Melia azedarach]|uniref:Uncharacterized protein n=1 Tax=Melia azedarach TaxID=155640 RepID=A0ACC1YP97_MELAZ|nr:hypothetical protein OWV82_003909 [Melia azedarach]
MVRITMVVSDFPGSCVEKRVVNSGQRQWRLSKLQRAIATFFGGRSAIPVVGFWSPASFESDGGLGWLIGGDWTAVVGSGGRLFLALGFLWVFRMIRFCCGWFCLAIRFVVVRFF